MRRFNFRVIGLFIAFSIVIFLVGCQKNLNDSGNGRASGNDKEAQPKDLKNFVQVNLVGNDFSFSPLHTDPNLLNPWGISFPPSGPVWVSAFGSGLRTAYNLDGVSMGTPLSLPKGGGSGPIRPSGNTFNPTADFKLPNGEPAQFILSTMNGTIIGCSESGSVATMYDEPSASYLGITMASDVNGNFFMYAANFAQNKIDVFDKNWNKVNQQLLDPDIPQGYSPYNVVTVSDGKIYVMYAKKGNDGNIESGPGKGYINIFSPEGKLVKRFATKGKLNTPWGITKAPGGFWGEWSQIPNLILVANHGDGHINVFDEEGNALGQLHSNGKVIEIDGLMGITFPPINGLNHYYMYFAAGPHNGDGGLVGYLRTQSIN